MGVKEGNMVRTSQTTIASGFEPVTTRKKGGGKLHWSPLSAFLI
jgi:hypothetical protein